MNVGSRRRFAPPVAAAIAVLVVALTACGSDPFTFQWSDTPDTAKLYSLDRPELNIPSAFSFYDRLTVPVESPGATGHWDAALDTDGGSLVLLPPGALGVTSRARIVALPGASFGDVTEAPADTAVYVANAPVPVAAGTIYIIRTGLRPGSFSATCTYYAKMEALDIDVAGGSLTFQFVTNPICNDRHLTPPT